MPNYQGSASWDDTSPEEADATSIFLQGDEVQSPTQGHLSLFCILSFNSLFQQPPSPTTICPSPLACSHSSTSSQLSIYILFNQSFLNPLKPSHNGQCLHLPQDPGSKQGRIESHARHDSLVHISSLSSDTVISRLTQLFRTGANPPTATREREVCQGPRGPARQVERGAEEEVKGGAKVAHLPILARYA